MGRNKIDFRRTASLQHAGAGFERRDLSNISRLKHITTNQFQDSTKIGWQLKSIMKLIFLKSMLMCKGLCMIVKRPALTMVIIEYHS